MQPVRVRFAPSPTGDLHIGGLRVALFNWLFARAQGGTYILRIEDTDQARYKPESVRSIIEGLAWAGLDWDEGPVAEVQNSKFKVQGEGVLSKENNEDFQIIEKGSCGPYFQSQRTEIYRKHIQILLEKGSAYHCFCTAERLDRMRKEQELKKIPPRYDKQCLNLPAEEVGKKINDGIPYVIRLKVPASGKIEVEDVIRGKITFDLSLVDDQVLLKSDGYPTYHLANVIDDHLMKITHVLRGEEWLSSVPKHLLLYQGFGWELPKFGHLPLILASDKTKLSKRHGAVSVLSFRDAGYLPDALLNFTLLLGWNPGKGSEQEIFSKDQMLSTFSLNGIQKSPAVFNYEKLKWMNGEYIKKLSAEQCMHFCIPHLQRAGLITEHDGLWKSVDGRSINEVYLMRIIELLKSRMTFFYDIVLESEYFFNIPYYLQNMLVWKGSDMSSVHRYLNAIYQYISTLDDALFTCATLEGLVKQWIAAQGIRNGDILWPLRVSLSGREKSVSPFEIMEILGKTALLKRISLAIDLSKDES